MTKRFPRRPLIRKPGTIECNNIIETTPIVWKDDSPCLRFIHVRTHTSTPLFAEDHTFGFPYAIGDTMYVVTGDSKT